MTYSRMNAADLPECLAMACDLWPNEQKEDLEKHFRDILASESWKTILCRNDNQEAIAFINLSIRQDYVEGKNSEKPVGYIEGIYVKPMYRKQGIARELARLGEEWSRERGSEEYASDTEMENLESQKFHRHIGFTGEQAIVHFIKKL